MNHLLSLITEAAAASQSRYASNPELRDTVAIAFVDDAVRAAPIRAVHFHGSETGSPPQALHWRLFFQLGGSYSGTSVEFNSQQLQTDFRTKLFVHHREYHSSNNSRVRGITEVLVVDGVTVGDVLSLVLNKKRDLYKLNSGGSGCRFWCLTVIGDLEHAHFVPMGSVARVEGYLRNLHDQIGNGWVPYPLYEGTFYG